MSAQPLRIFLDTNVYIVGAAMPESDEAAILAWAGFDGMGGAEVEVVLCEALFRQIRGVARRLQNKDWAGEILMRIWRHMTARFVIVDPTDSARLARSGTSPREELDIFLAARGGDVELFISANHERGRAAAPERGAVESLVPAALGARYLAE